MSMTLSRDRLNTTYSVTEGRESSNTELPQMMMKVATAFVILVAVWAGQAKAVIIAGQPDDLGCTCVPYYNCEENGANSLGKCSNFLDVCCNTERIKTAAGQPCHCTPFFVCQHEAANMDSSKCASPVDVCCISTSEPESMSGEPSPRPQPPSTPRPTPRPQTPPPPRPPSGPVITFPLPAGGQRVCSIVPAAGSEDSGVNVNILSCGDSTRRVSACETNGEVPAQTVVMANCWDSAILLLQCQNDGLWYTYRRSQQQLTSVPSPHVCQPQAVNSPVCGQRARYHRPPNRVTHASSRAFRIHWPWLVGLFRYEKYACTATVITPFYLLTAAHCVARSQETSHEALDLRDLRVQHLTAMGRPIRRYVNRVHLYPGYKAGTGPSQDVALVRLETPIVFSHRVYPACVLSEAFPSQKTAATFNRTTSSYKWEMILQRHDPRCHSPHDRCASALNIPSDQFCGIDTQGRQSLPEGSSGGPFLVNQGSDAQEQWTVAGILSWSRSESSCGIPYTVFTSLTDFWPWISDCIHKEKCS